MIALAILVVAFLLWRSTQPDGAVRDVPHPAEARTTPGQVADVAEPASKESLSRAPALPSSSTPAAIAAIEGVVLGNREPLHDASILFAPVGTEPDPIAGTYVFTDREGKFTIHPSRDVEHVLRVSKDGWSSVELHARPGDHVTAALDSPRSVGSISGQVVDSATDEPITDFNLGVLRNNKLKNEWAGILSRHIQESGGRFHEQLPIAESEIEIKVHFEAVGYREKFVQRAHVTRSAQVDLGKVAMEKIQGVRAGLVVDDRDGTPIGNAEVTPISDRGFPEESVRTDAAGRFVVEHQRASALSGFVAKADDFEPLYFALDGAQRASAEPPILRMKQGIELRGKVIAPGALPKDLQVGYWSDEVQSPIPSMPNFISKTVPVNGAGEYVLTHVPAKKVTVGLYRLVRSSARGQPHFERLSTVDGSDGQSRTIDFRIGDGFDVQLSIVAAGARPNAVVFVRLLEPGGSVLSEIEANVGPSLTFSDIPRGNYVLRVSTTKERFVEVPVSVLDDALKLGDVDISSCFVRR